MRMQKRAACFGGTKSSSNRGENQSRLTKNERRIATNFSHEPYEFDVKKKRRQVAALQSASRKILTFAFRYMNLFVAVRMICRQSPSDFDRVDALRRRTSNPSIMHKMPKQL